MFLYTSLLFNIEHMQYRRILPHSHVMFNKGRLLVIGNAIIHMN